MGISSAEKQRRSRSSSSLGKRFHSAMIAFMGMVLWVSTPNWFERVNAQPCPLSKSPFDGDYVFSNLKETTRMISNFAFLDASTTTQQEHLLYIFKQNGNQGIFSLDKATLLNSFNFGNLGALTAWDFSFNQRIFYHTLDILGNVYEIDGNYGRLNLMYATALTSADNVTVQDGACISFLYTTYVTWLNNTVSFVRYGDGATSSNRVTRYTFPETDLIVVGCRITEDKESVVLFTNKRGKIVSSKLSALSITVEYEHTETNLVTVDFFSIKGDYRIISFHSPTDDKSYIVVVKDKTIALQISQTYSTSKYLAATVDKAGQNLIYTDATGSGYVVHIADSTVLATYSFLELDIDYSDSSTYPATLTTQAQKVAFIQSLNINTIHVFNDGSTDFIFFQGSFTFFIFRLSTLLPVKFKAMTLASSTLIGLIPFSGNLIIVGNVQVTYLELITFKITYLNFVGTTQKTNNDNIQQVYIDEQNDRMTQLQVSLVVSNTNLSTLKYQKIIMTFTNQYTFFEVDRIHDKLILFTKRNSGNLSDGSSKYDVYIYQYSTGLSLYTFNTNSVYLFDVIVDSVKGEYFFVYYQTGVIAHMRFSSLTYDAPITTYTIPAWTTGASVLAVPSTNKLVVQGAAAIYVFDYYNSTPTITYTQTYAALLYFLPASSGSGLVVLQVSASNIQVISTLTSSSTTIASTSDGTIQATGLDTSNNYIFQAVYASAKLTARFSNIATATLIASLDISTTEQTSFLLMDQTQSTTIVIGTLGSFIVMKYTALTLTLYKSVSMYSGTPYQAYIDTSVGYLHVFYTDFTYAKYDYVLKLNYGEQEFSRKYTSTAGTLNRFFEDPLRGIIVTTGGRYIYILNYWKPSTVIQRLDLEDSSVAIVFNDVKVSTSLDMIAFGSTITNASNNSLYVLRYSTFTLLQKLVVPNASVRGAQFDEIRMRVFVYCRLGAVFVFTIDSTTSFTLAISKPGYLGGSTVNQINFWPEKNIILMTSNSWWSKSLTFDTLEDINAAIPGILGFFEKDLLLTVMYDHLGQIWVYDFRSSMTLFSEIVHTSGTRVNFVLITKEPSLTHPTIISGGDDKYLIVTREYSLSNRKTFLHTSEIAVGYFDFTTQVIICGDKLGNLLIFKFSTLTLVKIIKQHSVAIIQLSVKTVSNVIITSGNDGSIVIWDYFNIMQLESTGSLVEFFGINSALQVGSQVYFTDGFGLVQQWDQSTNQLKFGFYQKRAEKAHYQSTITQISNTNTALVQFLQEFDTLDLTTLERKSLSVSCFDYGYYSNAGLATCINLNSVTFVSTSLVVLATVTITSPDSTTIKRIDIVPEFSHALLVQVSGHLSIYTYSADQTTFTPLTTIVNTGISQIIKLHTDPTNSLMIIAYADGTAYSYTYTSTAISGKTTFTSIPYSTESNQIAILQVFNSNKIMVRRQMDTLVSVLEYPSLSISRNSTARSDNYLDANAMRPNVMISPCTGADSSIDVSEEYGLMILSCNGVYNMYSTTDMTFINSVRQISNITSKYQSFQRKRAMTLKFINADFFIDAAFKYLFIFKVTPSTTNVISHKDISLTGSYYSYVAGNYLSTISKVYVNGDLYAFEALQYSQSMVEKVVMPLVATTALCKLETSAVLFLRSLESLENVYSQSSSFSTVQKFQLVIQVTEGINLPFFPTFLYSSISQILVAPTGVSNPPATSDQAVRVKAYGSSTFFSSASQYLELYMNNLAIIFENSSQTVSLCELSTPLQLVDFSYLDISSNVPDMQIRFSSIPTVNMKEISIKYTAASSSGGTRMLASTATATYSQVLFLRFITVISLNVNNLTVEGQFLQNTSIISVMNPSDPTSLTTAQMTASVTMSGVLFKDNELISTVSAENAESTLNSLIELSFVPVVKITNLIGSGNYSPSLRKSGMISTQACSKLTIEDSSFLGNSNLFFVHNNATYSEEEVSSSSLTTSTSKYYLLRNTQATLSGLVLSGNKVQVNIGSFIKINSHTLTATSLTFSQNSMNVVANTPATSTTLFNLISVYSATLNTITFTSNVAAIKSLLTIDGCTIVAATAFTVSSNSVIAGSIYASSSVVAMTASTFTSNQSSTSGAGVNVNESTVSFASVNFENHSATLNGAAVYAASSTVSVSTGSLKKNVATGYGGSIYVVNSVLNVAASTFEECSAAGSGGSIAVDATTLTVTDSEFKKSTTTSEGGAIYTVNQSKSVITNSAFTSNHAGEGGAIYFNTCKDTSMITSATFTSNLANGSGGALMMDQCDSGVTGSKFKSNIAAIGGALRYTGLLPTFLKDTKESDLRASQDSQGYWVIATNFFQENTAVILGPEIGGVFSRISLEVQSDDFEFKQLKVDDPSEKVDTNTDFQYEFLNLRSGARSFTYNIYLYDLLNQRITQSITESAEQAGFTLSSKTEDEVAALRCKLLEIQSTSKLEEQNISIDGSVIVDYGASKEADFFGFSFDSIQIIGIPQAQGSFCMSFEGLMRLSDTNSFVKSECVDVLVQFRKCVVGEIYSPRCTNCIMNSCAVCSTGTYSLVEPTVGSSQQCLNCNTQNSKTCSANHIELLSGYWRENNSTDLIEECSDKYKACTGTMESHYCAIGYVGALCETCDSSGSIWSDRYGMSSMYQVSACLKCDDISGQQIYQVFILIFIAVYIFFQMLSTNWNSVNYIKGSIVKQIGIVMVQTSLVKTEFSVLSKLLIHYISVQEIINQFSLKSKELQEQVYSVPKEFLFPISNLFHGFDCSIDGANSFFGDTPIEYARLLLTFLQCLTMLFVIVILYCILIFVLQRIFKYNLMYIKAHYLSFSAVVGQVLFFIYYMQQTITSSSIQILTCKTIGGKDYLASQLNKECYTDEYYRWFPLVFITFVLSAFVYPLTILFILNNNKQKFTLMYRYRSQRRYGFLYFEFKPNCWWWEVLKILLRQVIIIVTQMSIFELLEKACLILILLLIYLILTLKYKPYKSEKLNTIDIMLNLATVLMIICSIYSHGITSTFKQQVLSILIFVLKFTSLLVISLRLLDSFLMYRMNTLVQNKAVTSFFQIFSKCLLERLFCQQNGLLRRNFPSLYVLIYKPQSFGINKHYRWRLLQVHTQMYLRRKKDNPQANFFTESNMQISKHADKSPRERVKDCFSKILLKSYSKVRESAAERESTNTPKVSHFRTLANANVNMNSNSISLTPTHATMTQPTPSTNINQILGSHFPHIVHTQTISESRPDQPKDSPNIPKHLSNRFDFDGTIQNSKNKLFSVENTFRDPEEIGIKENYDTARSGGELASRLRFSQSSQISLSMPNDVFIDAEERVNGQPINVTTLANKISSPSKVGQSLDTK